jgi:hypothetical protein
VNPVVGFAPNHQQLLKGANVMKQVEIKKVYVEPKLAELGNVSTITLGVYNKSGSCSVPYLVK